MDGGVLWLWMNWENQMPLVFREDAVIEQKVNISIGQGSTLSRCFVDKCVRLWRTGRVRLRRHSV